MKQQLPPIIIFAATYYPNSTEALRCEEVLKNAGISFRRLEGFWQGNKEYSYLTHAKHEKQIQKIMFSFGQSFYLFSDSERQTSLMNSHGVKISSLGKLRETHKPKGISYTRDPTTGKFWEARL